MFNKKINTITYQDINELLYVRKVREGERLDYKRDFHKDGKEFAKDLSAFTNAKGGYIIYGIDEKQNLICGISDTIGNIKIEDWISNVVNTNLSATVHYKIQYIPIGSNNEKDLFIMILLILESETKPIYVTVGQRNIVYLRKGSSVFSAKPSDIKKMYIDNIKIKEQKDEKEFIGFNSNNMNINATYVAGGNQIFNQSIKKDV